MGNRGRREFIQVLRLMEAIPMEIVASAVTEAIRLGAIGFDVGRRRHPDVHFRQMWIGRQVEPGRPPLDARQSNLLDRQRLEHEGPRAIAATMPGDLLAGTKDNLLVDEALQRPGRWQAQGDDFGGVSDLVLFCILFSSCDRARAALFLLEYVCRRWRARGRMREAGRCRASCAVDRPGRAARRRL